MQKQWKRLEKWLDIHNPVLLADLNPPANDADIKLLEQELGIQLPVDFVECLRFHNGQRGKADWLFSGSEFLSSQRILDEWTIWKNLLESGEFDDTVADPEFGIQPLWWCSKWIPFTYNGAGDHLCLDLAPASGGIAGQIITLWHDDGKRKKKADSFAQWFAEFVDKTV